MSTSGAAGLTGAMGSSVMTAAIMDATLKGAEADWILWSRMTTVTAAAATMTATAGATATGGMTDRDMAAARLDWDRHCT